MELLGEVEEPVLSSQIEGTQSSLSDLLKHELDGRPAGLKDNVTGGNYGRCFAYAEYLNLLNEDSRFLFP